MPIYAWKALEFIVFKVDSEIGGFNNIVSMIATIEMVAHTKNAN